MIAMSASVVNARRSAPAANCPPPPRLGRGDQRDRADAERQRRHADERRQQAPDDEQHADEIDVDSIGDRVGQVLEYQVDRASSARSGCRRADRDAHFDAHRAPRRGDVTRKRKRAPSATPAGTETRTGWWNSDSPVPQQGAHGSVHVSPRPPQCGQVPRTGTFERHDEAARTLRAATATPRRAARRRRRLLAENASRIRSTTRPTDGKSIAISSAKHSCDIKVPLTIGVDPRLVKASDRC